MSQNEVGNSYILIWLKVFVIINSNLLELTKGYQLKYSWGIN